jgi:hypothetical protein
MKNPFNPITSNSFETRAAALAKLEADETAAVDAEERRHKAEMAAARAASDERVAKARADAEATRIERERDLAAQALEELSSVVPELETSSSRAAAKTFASRWDNLDAKTHSALGQPLSWRYALLAFANAHGTLDCQGHPDAFSMSLPGTPAEIAEKLVAAVRKGEHEVIIGDLMNKLELGILKRGRIFANYHQERLRVVTSFATKSAQDSALEAYDHRNQPKQREPFTSGSPVRYGTEPL